MKDHPFVSAEKPPDCMLSGNTKNPKIIIESQELFKKQIGRWRGDDMDTESEIKKSASLTWVIKRFIGSKKAIVTYVLNVCYVMQICICIEKDFSTTPK